jgi:hypothetical protein
MLRLSWEQSRNPGKASCWPDCKADDNHVRTIYRLQQWVQATGITVNRHLSGRPRVATLSKDDGLLITTCTTDSQQLLKLRRQPLAKEHSAQAFEAQKCQTSQALQWSDPHCSTSSHSSSVGLKASEFVSPRMSNSGFLRWNPLMHLYS